MIGAARHYHPPTDAFNTAARPTYRRVIGGLPRSRKPRKTPYNSAQARHRPGALLEPAGVGGALSEKVPAYVMGARRAPVAVDRNALATEQPHALSGVGRFGCVAAPCRRHLPTGR
jgi:hypothetical protein